MESLQQQQQQGSLDHVVRSSRNGGSNRIEPFDMEGDVPPFVDPDITTNSDKQFNHDEDEDPNYQKPGWRKFLSHVGPGFLVALAYIDPGNMETDLQAGATYGYELIWVVLVGLLFALIIQSLAANLGVSTGKHLAEICKAEYPKFVTYSLWLLGESAVICADIPEVIGTAFALNILFHIPIWAGVLITGSSTLILLGVTRFGVRKLELLISILVFVMAACFFGEMGYVKPPAVGVLKGTFIPKLNGHGAIGLAIATVGATVMPHNLFLHSALVLSRKVPNSIHGINDACRYFLLESGFAIFIAFLINVAIISVSGTVCSAKNLTEDDVNRCNNLNLDSATFLLKNVLGRSSSIIYGIALLASGQSSAISGTYAGQFIMQGFLDLKMRKWTRNLMTRSIAIVPSLIVSLIGGPPAAAELIIITSMILSFELPIVLIPLLKFSSSTFKIGPHKNSIYTIIVSGIIGLGMTAFNIYYMSTGFVGWLLHNNLSKVANVFVGILIFPLMVIYILALIYLAFRKDTIVTYIEPTKDTPAAQNNMEHGRYSADRPGTDRIPYREDLADIPLPN